MGTMSELDRWISQLKRCELLRESEVKILCQKALEVLVEEGNVQRVDTPVTICETPSAAVHLLCWQRAGRNPCLAAISS